MTDLDRDALSDLKVSVGEFSGRILRALAQALPLPVRWLLF
jgi:hypothetical protein